MSESGLNQPGVPEPTFETWEEVRATMAELWFNKPTISTAVLINARMSRTASYRNSFGLIGHRLAVARSFTIEPLLPLLKAEAWLAGIDLQVHLGDFNSWAQELLDPASGLYQFAPETILLAVELVDLEPGLWRLSGDDSWLSLADKALDRLRRLVDTTRSNTNANLLIQNFNSPCEPVAGIGDAQREDGQQAAISRLNAGVRNLANSYRGVYVVDYAQLVAQKGRTSWRDETRWLTVRLPIASKHLVDLAREWMRYLCPLTGKLAKVCVVDLDNTLWGGVIGEDGPTGIQLSTEYPGAAFQEVQRALLELHRRGIILAIASKNNEDDAWEVIDNHPGMLLKRQHFAAWRINWSEKTGNLREIAAELNVGTDSLAFLDDNPIEQGHVRALMPEVFVLPAGMDGWANSRLLREAPVFSRLSVSEEDSRRTAFYHAERQRQVLHSSTTTEEFLTSLEQRAEAAAVTPITIQRVAQLTQKTNQFNLTTKRYTVPEIEDLAARADWGVYTLRVIDRFADNGVIAVAICKFEDSDCRLDTFLMSCRVIRRGIETAFLSWISSEARRRGARSLSGWFLPTPKNAPAAEFYPAHGFALLKQSATGSLWNLSLEGEQSIGVPPYIKVSGIICYPSA